MTGIDEAGVILPNHRTLAARLAVYSPEGSYLGLLAKPISWEATFNYGSAGSLSLEYSLLSEDSHLIMNRIDEGLMFAVQVICTGMTEWVEPLNARFYATTESWDIFDASQKIKLTCPQVFSLLSKARLLSTHLLVTDTESDNQGKVGVLGPAGEAILTRWDENKTRGGVCGKSIQADFTNDTDSAGVPWSSGGQYRYFDWGAPYDEIITSIVSQSGAHWVTRGNILSIYLQEGAQVGRDLTSSIILQPVSGVTNGSNTESIANLLHMVGINTNGDPPLWFTYENPDSTVPKPYGSFEGSVSQSDATSQSEAIALTLPTFNESNQLRTSYTRDLRIVDCGRLPFIDYQLGDWIMVTGNRHFSDPSNMVEKARIAGLQLAQDKTTLKCTATFGSLHDDFASRLLKASRRQSHYIDYAG